MSHSAKNSTPLLSIIMPFKNSETYILEAVSSVLYNKDLDCELLCVNDSSTDCSREVLQSYDDCRLECVENEFLCGIAGALNTGVARARGVYVGFCGSDNRRPSNSLCKQLHYIETDKELIAVCGGFVAFSDHNDLLNKLNSEQQSCDITRELLDGRTITSLGTFVIRRKRSGGLLFRDWFKSGEDIDYQLRLAERGRVYFLQGSYYHWRIHDGSITHQQDSAVRRFFASSAKQFRLQRAQRGYDDLDLGLPPPLPEASYVSRMSADEHSVSLLIGAAWDEYRQGKKLPAIQKMLSAITIKPLRLSLWKALAVLVLKSLR